MEHGPTMHNMRRSAPRRILRIVSRASTTVATIASSTGNCSLSALGAISGSIERTRVSCIFRISLSFLFLSETRSMTNGHLVPANLAPDGPRGLLFVQSVPHMDQTHPDKTAFGTSSRAEPDSPEGRRSGLWRALAGMAAALAVAAVIITIDLSKELVERMAHYH